MIRTFIVAYRDSKHSANKKMRVTVDGARVAAEKEAHRKAPGCYVVGIRREGKV